jgi:hypothetical protein
MLARRLSTVGLGLFALGLAACAHEARVEGEQPPLQACNDKPAQFAVGRDYSEALAEQARQASGARAVRGLFPGQMVTMEYRGDRLNLRVDDQRRVTHVNCG